jgi:hypothetical protein
MPGSFRQNGAVIGGLQLAGDAIEKMQSEKDALPALLPIGLGQRSAEFDEVFMDTFQLVVLRGQKPHAVLDLEAERLDRLMTETGASCWQPDPPSTGACRVQQQEACICRQSTAFVTRPLRPIRRRGFRSSSLWRLPKRCP